MEQFSQNTEHWQKISYNESCKKEHLITRQDKRKIKESRLDLSPWEGAVKERFPRAGNPIHWLGDDPGQKGSFKASEENAATGLWQVKETSSESPGHLAGECRGWVAKLRL